MSKLLVPSPQDRERLSRLWLLFRALQCPLVAARMVACGKDRFAIPLMGDGSHAILFTLQFA